MVALLPPESCKCAKHGLYSDGVLWRADLTENHAYRFCCLSGFRCRLHDLSCCISSKHGVWLWWVVFLGFCDLPKWKPCLANVRHSCGVGVGCCRPVAAQSAHFAAYLLSMVLGEIRLLPGLQNVETMLRTPEALGVSCPAPQHAAPPRPVVSCPGGVGESTSSDERMRCGV